MNVVYSTKREAGRRPTSLMSVRLEGCNGICYGFIRDVSSKGMSVFGLKSLPVGNSYDLEFELPDIGSTIRCRATVRWSWPPTQSFVSVCKQGMMFEELDPDSSRLLDDWVRGRLPRIAA